MNCRKVRPYLYGYCRNELTPAEAERIKAHLDECPECVREMEKVGEITALLKDSLEVLVPSPDFNEKLLAKIRSLPGEVEERKKQSWWQKLIHETYPSIRLRWVVAGAVSVMVLALVTTMLTQNRFSSVSKSIVSDNTLVPNKKTAGSGQNDNASLDEIIKQAERNQAAKGKSYVIENLSTASLDKVFDSTNRGEDGMITPVDLNRRFIIERSSYQDLSRGNRYVLPVVSTQPATRRTDY
jgi:hypothetical protein